MSFESAAKSLDQAEPPGSFDVDLASVNDRIRRLELEIGRARAEQLDLIDRLRVQPELMGRDVAAVAEHVSEHADVSRFTAARLAEAAGHLPSHAMVFAALSHGDITFDRATAMAALAELGLAHSVDIAWMRSVAELQHLVELAPTAGADHEVPPARARNVDRTVARNGATAR